MTMRKYLYISALLLIAILNSGCQTAETQPEELPAWVRYPYAAEEFQRFLTGVGYAHKDIDEGKALQIAKKNARSMLSDQVADHVAGSLKDFIESHPEYVNGRELGVGFFSQNLADEVVKDVMRRSFQEDVWRFQDGRIHLMLKVPLTVVNEAAKQYAGSLNKDYRLWKLESEALILEEFFDSLDSELKARVAREAAIRQYRKAISMGEMPHSQLPQWLASGKSDQYPSEDYLLSTGIGLSVQEAKMNAQVEALNKIFELCIDSIKPDNNIIPEKLKNQIEMLDLEKITIEPNNIIETETGKSWYDSAIDVHYALAVIDRNRNAENCKKHALKALKDWQYLLRSGINQRQAANFNRASADLKKAVHKAKSALINYLIAHAIKPADWELSQFVEKLDAELLYETYIELDKLLSAMEILPESGPENWHRLEQDHKKLMSVKLVAGDKKEPIADIPIQFEFRDMEHKLLNHKEHYRLARTKPDGIAEADFSRLPARSQSDNFMIRVQIAFEQFLPEGAIHQNLSGPFYEFDHTTKEIEMNIPLTLFIQEKKDGIEKEINEGEIALKLVNRLNQANVEIIQISDGELEPESLVDWEFDAIKENLKTYVNVEESALPTYFLTGFTENNITDNRETDFGILSFAACKVHLVLIDFSKTYVRPLLRIQLEGLGTAIDSQESALASSAEDAAMKVEEKLRQHLKVK